MIEVGDPMPYIPEWQTQLSLGVENRVWSLEGNIRHQSLSYDQAIAKDRIEIAPYGTVDVNAEYKFEENKSFFLRGQNILDKEYVTSFRPIGARPGRPLTILVGTQMSF
jgi:Fe(3+) dicitrate transport protein